MANRIDKPYHQLPVILFLFIQMISLGTYIVFFLITFLTFDPQPFLEKSEIFYQVVSEMLLIGAICVGLLTMLKLQNQFYPARTFSLQLPEVKEEIRWFLILLGALALILIVKFFEIDLNLVSFLVFLGAVTYLFHLAQYFSFSLDRPSWQHPTTAGAIIEGSVYSGLVNGSLEIQRCEPAGYVVIHPAHYFNFGRPDTVGPISFPEQEQYLDSENGSNAIRIHISLYSGCALFSV